MYIPVDSDVSRRANYLVNEIKLEWIKGRAVVRMQCYPAKCGGCGHRGGTGTVGEGKIIGGKGMVLESDSRMRLSRSAEVALHVRR